MLFFHAARSTTWITVENGSWRDSSVWLSGIPPGFSLSDTIMIRDTLTFDEDIHLNVGAVMQIESMGGALCGHNNITVNSGAILNKYGTLNLDSLFIDGGMAEFVLPGPFLMWLTRVSNGGSLHISSLEESCLCAWNTCFIPIPIVIPPGNPVIPDIYTLFPNPSNGNFNLEFSQANERTFYFYNMLGQIVFSTALEGTSGVVNFNKNYLNNGLYYWEVKSGETIYGKGKHFVIN
jgi:hypothetical protein